MSHVQYLQEEAARLVVEGRVSLLYEVSGTAVYMVEEETQTCRVHLKPDGRVSCTCPDWNPGGEHCLHILASQFCHHVQEEIG
jgi:hypothetical protein